MNLITPADLTTDQINTIFSLTERFQMEEFSKLMEGRTLCNCFFEPSTRTSLSFETAMKKLGGNVINFNKDVSSQKKGESDTDTLKTLEQYADIIVLRHPNKEFLYNYQSKCEKIIINGGNGDGEHPTQAILDLYTITKYFDTNKQIKILFVGDIKHSRTIHSLETLLKSYNESFIIDYYPYPNCSRDGDNNIDSFEEINKYDVVYMTRLQKERFESYRKVQSTIESDNYILTPSVVSKMKEDSIILHPLPRNEEIDPSVDECKQAKYFEQTKNGVYVRMAILYYCYNFI